jgi:pimeloyl-ACP methyl ester carboxylesterase
MLVGDIATPFGPARIFGHLRNLSPTRPLVLLLRGAFPGHTQMFDLPGRLTEADVLIGDLPGMDGSPVLRPLTLENFAAFWDAAMRSGFGHRPFVLAGVSAGGVVGSMMQTPAALVALDPPMSAKGMLPLIRNLTPFLEGRTEADREWAQAILHAEADYRDAVLSSRLPGLVLAGNRVRVGERLRSLISPDDLALLAAHPTLRLKVIPQAGHNLPRDAPDAVVSAIREAIALMSVR